MGGFWRLANGPPRRSEELRLEALRVKRHYLGQCGYIDVGGGTTVCSVEDVASA